MAVAALLEPEEEDDPLAELSLSEPDDASSGAGVIVHVVNERTDEDRGLLELARYRGTTTQAGGNLIVITTNYEKICTEPCGVPVDVSERPILFFVRDGAAVSHGFRLKDEGEVTLSVRPLRPNMHVSGFYLTFLFFPAGIPLLLLGRSKVSIASGPPKPGQVFTKVKKAKS